MQNFYKKVTTRYGAKITLNIETPHIPDTSFEQLKSLFSYVKENTDRILLEANKLTIIEQWKNTIKNMFQGNLIYINLEASGWPDEGPYLKFRVATAKGYFYIIWDSLNITIDWQTSEITKDALQVFPFLGIKNNFSITTDLTECAVTQATNFVRKLMEV